MAGEPRGRPFILAQFVCSPACGQLELALLNDNARILKSLPKRLEIAISISCRYRFCLHDAVLWVLLGCCYAVHDGLASNFCIAHCHLGGSIAALCFAASCWSAERHPEYALPGRKKKFFWLYPWCGGLTASPTWKYRR